ncbi:type VI secretion system tube protein TssD [Trabulsiella odontotermitis]|uniref:type VI secretion system tube protein TssD n=1 Tax=Trabulsiella odontotermitis TaxID=379893 RepID=UPI003ACE37D2
MSDIIYLTLRGAQQGLISSGCGSAHSVGNHYQQSHPDEIFVFSLRKNLARTPQQMVPQGLTFCKPVDKSSPLLMQAINNNERLTLNFSFYRINPNGRWEKYYAIDLRSASIQQIQCNAVVDNIHQEYITIGYDYIHCRHLAAGTEYDYLVTPENYNEIFPPEIPPQKSPPAKRKMTLTLGIFFDGTGNNAVNTRNMLAACTAQHFDINNPDAVSILERNAQMQLGISGSDATSYKGYYTNIHWLHELYKIDMPANSKNIQGRIYVEGIGTRAGEADSQIGMGLGISDTGVIAKTDDAVRLIPSALRSVFERLHEDIEINALQFDIFGFSRGAAAARHFANRVQEEDRAIIAAIRQGMGDITYSGAPAGKTRFIGLFDTVAAIGTPLNGLNPHSADTGEVRIRLRPGVAEKVFQITAGHECRFNFASNSVRPAWPELMLPGVHSDIGGGYLPQEREALFLTRPQTETVPLNRPGEKTRAYRLTMAQLRVMEASPAIAPIIRNNPITPEVWADERMPTDRYGQMQKRSFAALTLRQRIVRNDWSKVTLRVMIAAAEAAGVVLNNVDTDDPVLVLPAELQVIAKKALTQGENARRYDAVSGFTSEELDVLASRYIHCSASWNAIEINKQGDIQGGAAPAEIVSFVNRPDEGWIRTVYNMDGKKA